MYLYNRTLGFYRGLWSTVFQPAFPLSMCSLFYAYDLYDYALFEYNHNPQVRNVLNESGIEILATLAASQQRELNGDVSESGKHSGDMIRAVSGRMLASKIASEFRANVNSGGKDQKLSLMFGSHAPFMAFFALSNLGRSPWANDFDDIPSPGAAMVFELFAVDQKNTSIYPSRADLQVRFLYRPSTDPSVPLKQYPLFSNNTQVKSMPYNEFLTGMDAIGITSVSDWCDACDSPNLFCSALQLNQQGGGLGGLGGRLGGNLAPQLAGVIGAAVTLAVLGLAAAAAVVFGRIRFYRAGKGRNSSLGGFKGAEKMASDVDVSVAGGGARHERVGSWELRPGHDAVAPVGAVLAKETAVSNVRDEDDDTISILGAKPVKPREGF